MFRRFSFIALLLLVLVSCQNSDDRKLVYYSDAVVTLSQVDPAYRPYFQAQNGANFSAAEQRAALAAAAKTARTPVPTSMNLPARKQLATRTVTTAGKKGAAAKKAALVKKGAAVKGKSAATAKKPVVKGKTAAPAKKGAKPAAKKPAAKKGKR